MELEKLLEWRRSYRKFDEERELSKDDIDGILNSIKFASCANNRQFLRFISVESKEKVLKIFDKTRWAASLPNGAGRPKEGERPVYFIAILSDKEKKLKFDGVDQGLLLQQKEELDLASLEVSLTKRCVKFYLMMKDTLVASSLPLDIQI